MSTTVGQAVLELVTDVKGFRADLQTIKSDTASAMSGISKGVRVAAAAFAALDLAAAAKRAVDAGSEIADAAERFGIGAEAVQRLAFAAEQGGGSIEHVGTAIKTMATHLTEGDKSAVGALDALHLNLEELRAMTPDQAFTAIADAIAKVPDPMRQSALAVDLFGKAGTELLPAIKAGITAVGAAAPVMEAQTVASLDATGDAWAKMQKRLDTLKAEALAPVLDLFLQLPDSLQVVAGGITAFAPSLESLGLGLLAIGGPSGAMAALSTAGTAVVTLFTTTLPAAGAVLATLFTTTLPAAFSAILPFLGPIGLIAAGVAAVVLVWKNWDAIVGFVTMVYNAVKTWLVDKFAALVNWIGEKVGAVTGFFKDMWAKVAGSSYVPDMLTVIADSFAQLDAVMVNPALRATTQVAGAFNTLAADHQSSTNTMTGATAAWLGATSGIFGALGKKFKGFAIAEAIIATYMSIAKTLATTPWPANLILAAGAAAAGFANVAKIKSSETPAFAAGGIVTRPLLGLVGEAGPEAILPLNRLGSLIGERQTQQTIIVRLDERELVKAVVRGFPRELSLAGLV